jgi:hypothetical protein
LRSIVVWAASPAGGEKVLSGGTPAMVRGGPSGHSAITSTAGDGPRIVGHGGASCGPH